MKSPKLMLVYRKSHRYVGTFFGGEVTKIASFSYEEKRKLFTHHYPYLSFNAFYSHLEKTNATNFLDNPQMLILLGKAFSQQQYNFSNKRDIFTFSIQALAKEQSENFPDHHLSRQNKITYAGELFTILLLSNSEGVSNKESVSNAHYPCLKDLLPYEHIQDILNTKLFKIADTENQYIATHKMVAEFCAAEYLSERLISSENPLSLKQLLAILAPNNIIRDDLRGVCAWTACLSHSKNIQETFIHLDPYGVLTYGDPDILLPTSKKILIEQLIQFADTNPDFIDYQYWNEVHAHNLISKDMENTVNDLLTQSTSFQIRFLVLQLLAKTHETFLPYVTLENLTLCQDEVIALRRQAALCLVNYPNTTTLASTIDKLFNENSTNSLNIISTLIENTPTHQTDFGILKKLFTNVSLKRFSLRHCDTIGSFSFLDSLIEKLDQDLSEKLLEQLSQSLWSHNHILEYDICVGYSITISKLLKHFLCITSFEELDITQLWSWIKPLYFSPEITPSSFREPSALATNKQLRKTLLEKVFFEISKETELEDVHYRFTSPNSHFDLRLNYDDLAFLLEEAFKREHLILWKLLFIQHRDKIIDEEKTIRKLLKFHARKNNYFMEAWYQTDKHVIYRNRKPKLTKLEKYVQKNLNTIEKGSDLVSLFRLAEHYLHGKDLGFQLMDGKALTARALSNAGHLILQFCPTIQQKSSEHSNLSSYYIQPVTLAFFVLYFRQHQTLPTVPIHILKTVKVLLLEANYSILSETEKYDINTLINNGIFKNKIDKKEFLLDYYTPQLQKPKDYIIFELLKDDIFSDIRIPIIQSWMTEYTSLSLNIASALLNILLSKGCYEDYDTIIKRKINHFFEIYHKNPQQGEILNKLKFWVTKGVFLCESLSDSYWNFLEEDKNNIFMLMDYAYQYHDIRRIHDRTYAYSLDAIKNILKRLATQWSKAIDNSDFIDRSTHTPENAYQFLCEVAQSLEQHPLNASQPIFDSLLFDENLRDYHDTLKAIYYRKRIESISKNTIIPTTDDIKNFLNKQSICSIETLKARVIEEFEYYQKQLNGGETFHKKDFYNNHPNSHINEEEASRKIASYFTLKLQSLNVECRTESHMHNNKRADILFSTFAQRGQIMLATEVKGQWNRELFSAIEDQLIKQYSIEPRTQGHGLYLVLWFGKNFPVAGRNSHSYTSKEELLKELEKHIPDAHKKFINIIMLDLSTD